MRATIDKLISWTGLVLAVVLLAAGGLLTWASSFVADQVHTQFTAQDITMPTTEALKGQLESGRLSQADVDALTPFAGETMLTGPAARAYAEHYITAHMNAGTAGVVSSLSDLGIDATAMEGFKDPLTYEAAGALSNAIKADTTLDADTITEATGIVNTFRTGTLFTGNTLVGLLLYGYAFATMGTIAGIAAIAAFVGGAVLLVLAGLGFWHSRKVVETAPAKA